MPENEQKLSSSLTHFSEKGDAHMVDVGHKTVTERVALAEGIIEMAADTLAHLQAGHTQKGEVLFDLGTKAYMFTYNTEGGGVV